MADEFPASGMELTHILVVSDPPRSLEFYRDVLRAEVYRQYGSSIVLRFLGNWVLLVTGGPPTADKPTVTFAPPSDPDVVSCAWTIRVADCQAAYRLLTQRGATFLTAPVRTGDEVRCFLRDPDGHLIELSEYRSGGSDG